MINPIASTFLTASVQEHVSSNYSYDERLPCAKHDAVSDHQLRLNNDVCRDDGSQAAVDCMKILNASYKNVSRKSGWMFWRRKRARV